MKITSTIFLVGSLSISFAQDPQVDSWMLNTSGTLASYEYYPGMPPTTQTVNMTDSADILQVCYDNDYVYIRTNGLASYQMGPWEMNPNVPQAISSTYRFPRNPMEETGTKTPQPVVGALGVAKNGIKLYGAGDARSYNSGTGQNDGNGDGLWNGDAWASEGATMDASGSGHPDQNGNYHYHATPTALYAGPTNQHSPIIGWAFDGYPIYGPYGYSDSLDDQSTVVRMETSFQLRNITDRTILPDGQTSTPPGPAINATFPLGTYWEDYEFVQGLGHLDEYNGRYCVTPDYPGGTYAYFITMDGSGTPQFPYITGLEYYGQILNTNEIGGMAGNITIPASVTCVTTVSVEENELDFSVYPNPATDILKVDGIDGAKYTIIDQLGREISTGKVAGTIDISAFEGGSYMIRFEMNDLTSFRRFIKE
ncbi:YHYH protein [Paracrocinitomix mangrovi]|uniref:YHYH protein n=1 Tax=Paracrocinitomix mangrovi TaxID=2862509 RepID=UPI001C8EFA3E|nr:YHYH protein [Paracrocinitomix mangrovi]UKN00109.1 YHYH protein [Paracrocinitomix mangrovi]